MQFQDTLRRLEVEFNPRAALAFHCHHPQNHIETF